jgi:hypothetical protein
MNEYGALVECYWQERTEVLWKKTKNCAAATLLSIVTTTWTGLVLNPHLHHETPATNRLNHVMAYLSKCIAYWLDVASGKCGGRNTKTE